MTKKTSIYIFTGDFNVGMKKLQKTVALLGGEIDKVERISHPTQRINPRQIRKAVVKLYTPKATAGRMAADVVRPKVTTKKP